MEFKKDMKIVKNVILLTMLASLMIFSACSGQPTGSGSGSSDGNVKLLGSGATFPKPIYEKWVNEYQRTNPTILIDYQAKGSGGGQKDILAQIVDFGASDDPMSDEDIQNAPGKLMHIPTVLGAVVITYNLDGLDKPLNLTSEIIAGVYMGEIKKWNDPKIKAENPEANLPDVEIVPVYRADSSGTTAVFTDYLSKTNQKFKESVTSSKQPNWIKGVGMGAKGNDGVLGQVKQTPNTLGYVEVAFAMENNLPSALIKNKAGKYVEPKIENVTAAAAASAGNMPEDLRFKITDADGDKSYPISSYTYMLVYQDQKDAVKGKALVDYIWWATHEGQQFAAPLHYAPLPSQVVGLVEKKIETITSGGKVLREGAN